MSIEFEKRWIKREIDHTDDTFFILSFEVYPEPNENKNIGLGTQTDKAHKDMNVLYGLIFCSCNQVLKHKEPLIRQLKI